MREFSSRKGGCHRGEDWLRRLRSRRVFALQLQDLNCGGELFCMCGALATINLAGWDCVAAQALLILRKAAAAFYWFTIISPSPPSHFFEGGSNEALPARNEKKKKAKLVRMQEKQKRNWQRGGEAWRRGDGKKGTKDAEETLPLSFEEVPAEDSVVPL